MSMHRCPATGCMKQVPKDQLACHKHWAKLPWRMRTNINEAWNNRDNPAHLAAISAAFDWYSTHDVETAPDSHGGSTTTSLEPSTDSSPY